MQRHPSFEKTVIILLVITNLVSLGWILMNTNSKDQSENEFVAEIIKIPIDIEWKSKQWSSNVLLTPFQKRKYELGDTVHYLFLPAFFPKNMNKEAEFILKQPTGHLGMVNDGQIGCAHIPIDSTVFDENDSIASIPIQVKFSMGDSIHKLSDNIIVNRTKRRN